MRLSMATNSPPSLRLAVLIGILSFLLIVPIDLLNGSKQIFTLPVSVVLIPMGIFCFLKSRTHNSRWLKLACLSGLLSVLITTMFLCMSDVPQPSFRSLASLLYFFTPPTMYFLAKEVVKTDAAFIVFLRTAFYSALVLAISLFLTVFVLGDGMVRTSDIGVMNGTFFSLPLSGAYGVHTTVDHYFTICILIAYFAQSGRAKVVEQIIALGLLLFFIFIMLLSLSREVVLAVLVVGTIYGLRTMNATRLVLTTAVFSLLVYIGHDWLSTMGTLWETKIYMTEHSQNLDDLSSGRLDLQKDAVLQLIHYPVTGTGFYGYLLTKEYSEGNDNIAGLTTHLYYLTTAWKMGLLGAAFYFTFFVRIVNQSIRFSREVFPRSATLYTISLWAFLLVLNTLWDALLAPGIMCLFAFLVGSMVRPCGPRCRVYSNSCADSSLPDQTNSSLAIVSR
jgi:hypothetical protein